MCDALVGHDAAFGTFRDHSSRAAVEELDALDLMGPKDLGQPRVDDDGDLFDLLLLSLLLDPEHLSEALVRSFLAPFLLFLELAQPLPFKLFLLGRALRLAFGSRSRGWTVVDGRIPEHDGMVGQRVVEGTRDDDRLTTNAERRVCQTNLKDGAGAFVGQGRDCEGLWKVGERFGLELAIYLV